MNEAPPVAYLWAKTSKDGDGEWHPLLLHLIDVAACADAVLAREPESTRSRMGECIGLDWEEARPSLLPLIACHDLGKACPSFQAKWEGRPAVPGLRLPRSVNKGVNHGFVSQLALTELLGDLNWPVALATLASDAVACHHGSRASERHKDEATDEILVGRGERLKGVRNDWQQARASLFNAIRKLFPSAKTPIKQTLTGPRARGDEPPKRTLLRPRSPHRYPQRAAEAELQGSRRGARWRGCLQ